MHDAIGYACISAIEIVVFQSIAEVHKKVLLDFWPTLAKLSALRLLED